MARNKKELLEKTIDEVVEYTFKTGQIDINLYNIDKDLIINAGLTGLKGTIDQLLVVIGLLREFAISTCKAAAFEEAFNNIFTINNDDSKDTDFSEPDNDKQSDDFKLDA